MKVTVEAVLFVAGKFIEEDYIAKVLAADKKAVKKALSELREDYDKREGCALRVANEGTQWKLTVRDEYLSIASKLVSDTEIQGTVLETLAVIAWKNPIMQSELIKIRGPAAYEHIAELAERGFVTKVAAGRSFKLTLLEKFFDYFDVEGREDLHKLFGPIAEQASAAQAEINTKQAGYDAQVRAAQDAMQGNNTGIPAQIQSPQPSAQEVKTDLLAEIKAAADKLTRLPDLPETEIEAEPQATPLQETKSELHEPAPAAKLESQPARIAGNSEMAQELVEAEKAVNEFGNELVKLHKEVEAQAQIEPEHNAEKRVKKEVKHHVKHPADKEHEPNTK